MKTCTISVTEFKARCLGLLDDVALRGQRITVTKRGRPVATVSPVDRKPWKSPAGALAGKVKITGNLDGFSMADLWNVVREADEEKKGNR